MTRLTGSALLLVALLLLAGCADRRYAVGYDLPVAAELTGLPVAVVPFTDARPAAERTGEGVGLLNSSTYDTMYTEPVAAGVTRALVSELRAAGVDARQMEQPQAQFAVTGTVLNYRAMRVPPFESFIPYVNNVTWLWTDDSIAVAVRVNVQVTDRFRNLQLLDRTYDASHDTAVWVGVLNLDSRVNSFTRGDLAKLLDRALQTVLQRAVADIEEAMTLKAFGMPPAALPEP